MDSVRAWAQCVAGVMLGVFGMTVAVAGFIALAAILGMLGCAIFGPAFLPCLIALVEVIMAMALGIGIALGVLWVMAFLWAAISCIFYAEPVAGALPTEVGGAVSSGSPIDCAAAQALLASARAGLERAERERDAAQRELDQARRRARNAAAGIAGAVAALAASSWNPFLIAGAIAALAAAIALSVRRARQLAAATAAFAAASARVAAALANLAAAEALVATLCAAPPAPGTTPPPAGAFDPKNSVLLGTRQSART